VLRYQLLFRKDNIDCATYACKAFDKGVTKFLSSTANSKILSEIDWLQLHFPVPLLLLLNCRSVSRHLRCEGMGIGVTSTFKL